jgi:hypothetical protein
MSSGPFHFDPLTTSCREEIYHHRFSSCPLYLTPGPNMSMGVLDELQNLFEWNTPVLQFAVGRGDSERELRQARQVVFYDMHLAPSIRCKRIVHVPYLHKKIAHIVDAKMQQIREHNIVLQSPSTGLFVDTIDREEKVDRKRNPLHDKRSVVDYYSLVTSEFCLPVASALAFHPKFWRSIITWSSQPLCNALGSYAASLQIIQLDKGKAYFGPEIMDGEVLERLEEMEARREDLATWEISSLSIEDTNAMLGVLTMATLSNRGEFKWKTSSGIPCAPEDQNFLKMPSLRTVVDAPEAIGLVESPWNLPESSTIEVVTHDSLADILDASLRRGGSSFEAVRDDISVKEAVVISFLETAGSETESEAGFKADPRENMPWKPPGGDHTISHELIQKVGQQTDIVVSWTCSDFYLFLNRRGVNRSAKTRHCSFCMRVITNISASAIEKRKPSTYQIFCIYHS